MVKNVLPLSPKSPSRSHLTQVRCRIERTRSSRSLNNPSNHRNRTLGFGPVRFGLTAALTMLAITTMIGGGCGGKRATGKANYSVTAKKNYEKGIVELGEEDWVAAAKYFSFIKARFPYSKYSVLAELRMADAEFGAGNYLRAIDGYKLFIKFHPTHEMVVNGYAAYRVGESYLKELPGNFWILPPRYEKDQSATTDAHRELSTFLKKYPESPFIPKVKESLVKINQRLAEHELYVARFYWKRNKPMGTVLRLRRLLDKHAGTPLDGDALWLLGRAYEKVKMIKRARETYAELASKHPNHKSAGDARQAVTRLPAS